MRKIYIGCFLLVCIVGCDPGATYEFHFYNASDVNLHVDYASINIPDTIVVVVGNSSQRLDYYSFIGNASKLDQDGFESLFFRIKVVSGDTIIYESDPANINDWDYKQEDGWMWSRITYKLIIPNR